MNNIIEARNVCMDFKIGDGSTVHALKGIDLQIPPNKLSVLRGRSGSGKTTLINILGALDRPTSGEVVFLDRDITKLPDKDRDRLRRVEMAFVFQSVALISTMTAFENVEFALRLTDMPYKERVERAKQSLIQVGLEKRINHRPGEMSGGEQQRV
ncbi:MAG TPA: macrolide ABC transporter ATP-binding protein, partial [Ruminococcaceae bacterium]|nr:macrolide ABC transporter ATP-binding protein [Oscillospiraceae bacterium]